MRRLRTLNWPTVHGRSLDSPAVPAEPFEARYRARSLWLDGLPGSLTPRRSLEASADCDVAIVGAGFTGLWSAYYLKQHQPDLRVVVVEREIAGFGPSGRNGGWASSGIAGAAKGDEGTGGRDAVLRAARGPPGGVSGRAGDAPCRGGSRPRARRRADRLRRHPVGRALRRHDRAAAPPP